MPSALPDNYTVLEAGDGGKTIREIAVASDVPYLTPYYLVLKKENVSETKDVIAVTEDKFYRGDEAREFLGMPLTGKTTISPTQVAAGVRVFVQSTSHNRKIPRGSAVLLQVASSLAGAGPGAAAPALTSSAPRQTTDRRDHDADSNPRPRQRARVFDGGNGAGPAASPQTSNPQGDEELNSVVLSLRLSREGALGSDDLQVSLIWNDIADLDLSCITPDGETIYYGHKESQCGGWLDVDMNVNASTASKEPVENIFWASAPSGRFVFRVTNFNCHTDPNTVFIDPHRAVPFRVFLRRGGKQEIFDGKVKHKEVITCFEFEHDGNGALGSFVVMPPSSAKTTFKGSCEKHGVTYTQGNGYYALARMENISANKAMLLQDTINDTFIIGAARVRSELGWSEGNIRKGPKDIPAQRRLFVQSTSHNRLIPPGTHVLMKVSVQEALKHRPAHNTQFANETHTMGRA